MKKNSSIILAAAACVLMAACFIKIVSLEKKVGDLQREGGMYYSNISNYIDAFSANIQNALEEQENLLSSSTWEYSGFDIYAKQASLYCEIIPKEYMPDATEVTILISGQEYPMKLENGKYTADVVIPLFEKSSADSVIMKTDGVIRTQTLQWRLHPQEELLPTISAHFSGSGTGITKKGVNYDRREGLVVINVDRRSTENSFSSASLVTVTDGEETERIPIDLSYEGQKGYLDQEKGNSRRAMPEPAAYASGEYSQLYYYLKVDREIPVGRQVDLYVEFVDNHDLHYVALCESMNSTERGLDSGSWYGGGIPASIYDKDGVLLYQYDESLSR